MEKIKLKICPFCGSEPQAAYRTGAVCVVECLVCRASGPLVLVEDFLNFGEDVTDERWNEAVDNAKRSAEATWNCRPFGASLYPEDLETMEDKSSGSCIY